MAARAVENEENVKDQVTEGSTCVLSESEHHQGWKGGVKQSEEKRGILSAYGPTVPR